jgi:hypothetical protein
MPKPATAVRQATAPTHVLEVLVPLALESDPGTDVVTAARRALGDLESLSGYRRMMAGSPSITVRRAE